MEIKAKVKHIRMSPKKIRLIANVVRGLETIKALEQLNFINKKATVPLIKLIKSAIANAEHNYELDKSNLRIKEIRVDEGRTLSRWKPRAHGRATPIRKKSSQVSLVLAEIKDSGAKKPKERKIEAPVNLEETMKKVSAESGEKKKSKSGQKAPLTDKKEDFSAEAEKVGGKKGFAGKIFRRKSG